MVGAVELLLNDLVDGIGKYLVVDMTAIADSLPPSAYAGS